MPFLKLLKKNAALKAACFGFCVPLFLFSLAAAIISLHCANCKQRSPLHDVPGDRKRDGGRVFSPTWHVSFRRRVCAAKRNKQNLQRPRPVLRPQHVAAVVRRVCAATLMFCFPPPVLVFVFARHFDFNFHFSVFQVPLLFYQFLF